VPPAGPRARADMREPGYARDVSLTGERTGPPCCPARRCRPRSAAAGSPCTRDSHRSCSGRFAPARVLEHLDAAADRVARRLECRAVGVVLDVRVDAAIEHARGATLLDLHAAADPRALNHVHAGGVLRLHVADHPHAAGAERRCPLDLDRPLHQRTGEDAARVLRHPQVVDRDRAERSPAGRLLGARARRHDGRRRRGRTGRHDSAFTRQTSSFRSLRPQPPVPA
jgi:hypothetical protein